MAIKLDIEDLDGLLGYHEPTHSLKGMPSIPSTQPMSNVPPVKPPLAPDNTSSPTMPSLNRPEPQTPAMAAPAPTSMPSMNSNPDLTKPHQSFWGKLGHGLATAGEAIAPGLASQIPGTRLYNQAEQGREAKLAGEQAETQSKQAQTAATQEGSELVPWTPLEGGAPVDIPRKAWAPLESAKTHWGASEQNTDKRIQGQKDIQDTRGQQATDLQAQKTADKQAAPEKPPETRVMGNRTMQWDSDQKKWVDAGAAPAKEGAENEGTWSLQEGPDGKPVLFNSKTGATREAPNGMEPRGTGAKKQAEFDKQSGPVETARQYAEDYLNRGVFTGPGDEALQEKFFELAKPSTGFRMTQPQIDMLQNSRGWMQGIEGHALHAFKGTWFTDQQRHQIVDTMNQIAKSKMTAMQSGGNAPQAAGGGQGVPKAGDVVDGYKFKGGNPADKNNWTK